MNQPPFGGLKPVCPRRESGSPEPPTWCSLDCCFRRNKPGVLLSGCLLSW